MLNAFSNEIHNIQTCEHRGPRLVNQLFHLTHYLM
jgi:hypothetical protein